MKLRLRHVGAGRPRVPAEHRAESHTAQQDGLASVEDILLGLAAGVVACMPNNRQQYKKQKYDVQYSSILISRQ